MFVFLQFFWPPGGSFQSFAEHTLTVFAGMAIGMPGIDICEVVSQRSPFGACAPTITPSPNIRNALAAASHAQRVIETSFTTAERVRSETGGIVSTTLVTKRD